MLKVQKRKKLITLLICLILVLTTFIAYQQVGRNGFLWDDVEYIINNSNVKRGITWDSVFWAFRTTHVSNWHPLTWLSHMLDCELFGTNPFYHHLVNLLFHIVNTLLLFWILKKTTGAVWRSGFVAALFALHPVHVESVAWVSERKDLLSGLFWMLTIAAYIYYTRRTNIRRYLLVVLALSLGLMAKPMLVTLPFVLLLLDYWPLGRFQWSRKGTGEISSPPDSTNIFCQRTALWRLIGEKLPLFILVAASSVVTFMAQQKSGSVEQLKHLTMDMRIANILVSYIGYIAKMAYPSRLAALYPHTYDRLLTWQPMVSAVVLLALTICIIYLSYRQRHYLIIGWLWYLGTLVPVIGLVQIGAQSMADRYTYLPSIGIFIIVAWGGYELLSKRPYQKVVRAVLAGLVVIVLLVCTRVQVRYWRDNLTLFGRAFEVTRNSPLMLQNLGTVFGTIGRLDEAVICYKEVLRLDPDHSIVHADLGTVLMVQGRLDEAIVHFHRALQLAPDFAEARNNMAYALRLQGDFSQAVTQYRKVLEIKPDHLPALNGIAWVLATNPELHDANQAIDFAERAAELSGYRSPAVLDTLAVACASAGQFPEAIETAEKALSLAKSSHKKKLAENIKKRLLLFKQGQPYVEKNEVKNP